jgi:D-serine deaminase-like pyridoxal phosphate-dependent protein
MNTQSDTKEGIISLPSNSNLTGKEGYLAKLVNSAGTPKADIAAAVTDNAVFVIEDGGTASGDQVDLRPLNPNRSVR